MKKDYTKMTQLERDIEAARALRKAHIAGIVALVLLTISFTLQVIAILVK